MSFFKSLSGQWNPQGNDWIVGLIIQEIAKIDNDFYEKVTDDDWFQQNINNDYSCVSDLYTDYNYDEDKYFNDIQSGKFKTYSEYIHFLAVEFVNELKSNA